MFGGVTRIAIVAALAALVATFVFSVYDVRTDSVEPSPLWPPVSPAVRQALFDELRVVGLRNCDLRRYGSANDGGYVMCANLVEGVSAAYSYGIDQEDNWGCDVSRQLGVTIHQYDCFTDKRPTCDDGRFVFHDQCVGPRRETAGGQPYDSVASQLAANGDLGKTLLLKMDIEGAEWDSLLATPDGVLDTIVQLPMEMHLRGASEATFLDVVRRLKTHFFLVNLHYNNWSCSPDSAPLASPAFQVLWVNKRAAVLDPSAPPPPTLQTVNAPDDPAHPECEAN
jgi:hypothetical protein